MNAKKSQAKIIPDVLMVNLLCAMPVVEPPAERRAAIRQGLMNSIAKAEAERSANEAAGEMRIVRAGEGDWITFAPNVAMKVLNDDGATRSWLARFGPGGQIPAHVQSGDEEAIVLQGWCHLDDVRIETGDYHFICKGARHGDICSPEGCLIFVRSHSAKRNASELTATR